MSVPAVESDAIAATALSIWRLSTSLFKKGKHALAWAATEAIPTIHYQPMVRTEGMKGCGGCHKIGLKSPEQVADLAKSGVRFGNASCNSCHTRHTFSVEEAKSPQACKTCHMGFDHPQWGDVLVVEARRA